MTKILVPASETNAVGPTAGGWRRIVAFVVVCAAIGVLIYGFAFDFNAPSTALTRGVIPFAVAVVVVAVLFARRKPLSKPRVDLLYYSLAAMSAAILYVDNADQRATVQKELDQQRLESVKSAVDRQGLEVTRRREAFDRADRELTQLDAMWPVLQKELELAKSVARRSLDNAEQAQSQMCAQVWRECSPMQDRLERDKRPGSGLRDGGSRIPSAASREPLRACWETGDRRLQRSDTSTTRAPLKM